MLSTSEEEMGAAKASLSPLKGHDEDTGKINCLMGPQEPLVATVKRRKFAWFEHVTRHDSLSKPILQGTSERGRRRGRQRKCWMDNIKEWTSLPLAELLTRALLQKRLEEDLFRIVPQRGGFQACLGKTDISPLLHDSR